MFCHYRPAGPSVIVPCRLFAAQPGTDALCFQLVCPAVPASLPCHHRLPRSASRADRRPATPATMAVGKYAVHAGKCQDLDSLDHSRAVVKYSTGRASPLHRCCCGASDDCGRSSTLMCMFCRNC